MQNPYSITPVQIVRVWKRWGVLGVWRNSAHYRDDDFEMFSSPAEDLSCRRLKRLQGNSPLAREVDAFDERIGIDDPEMLRWLSSKQRASFDYEWQAFVEGFVVGFVRSRVRFERMKRGAPVKKQLAKRLAMGWQRTVEAARQEVAVA